MNHEPLSAHLAVELARRSAGSARPDAPVVTEREQRPAPVTTARLGLAVSLRAVARWVEPARCPAEARQAS
jgi:hypothetical protein